jgi:predicted PurR-regulated permease PerM
MNQSHKEVLSMVVSIGIVLFSLFIVHRFIPSLVWAAIIVITTYPVYVRWKGLLKNWDNTAAFLFTFFLALLLVVPISWLLSVLVQEFQLFLSYVKQINKMGGDAPTFIQDLPIFGDQMVAYWDQHIGQPGNVQSFFSNLHLSLTTSQYIKEVGGSVVHRSVQVGFTLLSMFFLFRDGHLLEPQMNRVGELCLGERWYRFSAKLPSALRATVNGTIVVGAGVGILMGVCYGLIGVPAPTLIGIFTAFAAMIPFVVPLVFGVVALILVHHGAMIPAVIVIIWGTVVMFIADHFIKPVLIGGAIQLPFLAVLFGILGGLETMGILGLFVGPIVMVLFVTLWTEAQSSVVHSKKSQGKRI